MPKVLIVGASGLVGSATVDRFVERDGWEVVAVSRRKPDLVSAGEFMHLSVDLRDADATAAAFGALEGVTHIVYTALYEKPGLVAGWRDPDQMATNLGMIRNLLEPVLAACPGIQHLTLLQGTKAYGSHIHAIPVPARERAPRDPHENFYWLQEDYVRELAEQHGFAWTIFRPQLVIGGSVGVAMNVAPVIGVYAAICRAEGLPFAYPGGASYVWETVDARICASAIEWAAESPDAAGETFNLTNGDVFEWRHLWPALADVLGVENGADTPRELGTFLPEHAGTWERIVAEHGLRPLSLAQVIGESHHYADRCFAYGLDEPYDFRFVSTIKLRQAGFHDVMDTEETYRYWLGVLQQRGILPAAA
jgi:nucleoside-diphosphate-sugar epimerase